MKLNRNLFQGKSPSLEEGPRIDQAPEYFVLNRTERKSNCSHSIAIIKVILCIVLIIFIGWIGLCYIGFDGFDSSYQVKPCTMHNDGESVNDRTISEINTESRKQDIRDEIRRGRRSIESARETCERGVIATRRRLDSLAAQVVIGENSDPIIANLRQKLIHMMISLTLRVIFVQSNDTTNATGPTDEEWRTFVVGLKESIAESADPEHRQQFETSGPLSQELTTEIRDTVESMARNYMNCETILPTPKAGNSKGTTKQALRLVEIMLEGERCANRLNMTQERIHALTAQIVTGDPSDPIVKKLRHDAFRMLISIPEVILVGVRDEETIRTGLANTSNQQWETLLVQLKQEIIDLADFPHRQQIEANGPPTQEMIKELRFIVEYFLIDYRKCNKHLTNKRSARKMKRSNQQEQSEMISPVIIDCYDAEQQLLQERRARLEAIANEDVTNDQTILRTQEFLNAMEAALNATDPAEVVVEDDLLASDSGLIMWKRFLSNASLEFKKEFYELVRDEFLELRKQRTQAPEWEGYNLSKVYQNFTDGLHISSENATLRDVLNVIIKCGESFNLHYVPVEKENTLEQYQIPDFGTLTYLDNEPEKLGVSHMRNILNGYIRLFFRVRGLLGPCMKLRRSDPVSSEILPEYRRSMKKRSAVDEQTSGATTANCWNPKQEPVLLEERRERLEGFANDMATGKTNPTEQYFFNMVGSVLNATSTSDIQLSPNLTGSRMVLGTIEYLSTNISLELHKEAYEIVRDLFLELRKLNVNNTEWQGYDEDHINSITANLSDNMSFRMKLSAEGIFNDFIRIGEPFNLRYVGIENRGSEDDLEMKPVPGKFTYLGEPPEPSPIRKIRHVLDGFIKFYFKSQNPSIAVICNSDTQSTDAANSETSRREKRAVRKRITAPCWNKEQDSVLLDERRERLVAYANKNSHLGEYETSTHKQFLDAIEAALRATTTTEIRFDEKLIDSTMILAVVRYLVANASLQLHKEGYELSRDLFFEMLELRDHNPRWKDYNEERLAVNLTDVINFSKANMTPQSIFDHLITFGRAFNLGYEELEQRGRSDESSKPVFGKFTYVGDGRESLGARNLRHILDGFIKLYFKTQYPTTSGVCNPNGQTVREPSMREKRSVEKRFVTENPIHVEVKCWGMEQDPDLVEERRARLENFDNKFNKTEQGPTGYIHDLMQGIKEALNATSTSEIHFTENVKRGTPMLRFIDYLTENSSLELHKEGYEFSRDLFLEMLELRDQSPGWEGFDEDSISANITDSNIFVIENMTSEAIFDEFVKFARIFNLRYDELASRKIGDDTSKPVFGKFTYVGQEPEKAGIRRLRHILDSFVKMYFKIQNPSSWGICDTSEQPRAEEGNTATPIESTRSV